VSVAEDDDTTPVTAPGRRLSSVPGGATIPDGLMAADVSVPEHVEFEETGKIAAAFEEKLQEVEGSPMEQSALITALAEKLLEKGGGSAGGGGSGVPPEEHAKSIKRHNWGTIILAALLGPGGFITAWYALVDRSKDNSAKVEQLDAASKSMDERVEQTEKDVKYIKVRVGEVSSTMSNIQVQQTEISNGIKALKQENVQRLERELQDARRELRRRRGYDDD